jgi:hypothetical protein
MSSIKKFDMNLRINYDINELKNLNKTIIINKYVKSLDEFIASNPNANKVPIDRKIVKLVNKNLVILDGAFPSSKFSTDFSLVLINQKKTNELNISFNLMVYGEYVYCFRCEFLTYYKVGDSLLIVKFYIYS